MQNKIGLQHLAEHTDRAIYGNGNGTGTESQTNRDAEIGINLFAGQTPSVLISSPPTTIKYKPRFPLLSHMIRWRIQALGICAMFLFGGLQLSLCDIPGAW
ncbi:hypothetical protein K504DRAFT_457288 [Pleomassaria siparia CBS 279.74]|uniref:Uncharacterized protein n=1 Tax=Pleomassaria siparia CBS 279.74 TaxID=1314801 RepID=A0A6G1KQK5_9PLEO|nr:hypothetical protein K504DRAFT_457288 [Pleomassaria siparia CBS 279.74]